ncbi:hypothetical protein NQZ70_01557 [Sorangium sp. Soce836]|nr:hypothetical protein NQZ70_01557 [Sorangium sp. Soce836]
MKRLTRVRVLFVFLRRRTCLGAGPRVSDSFATCRLAIARVLTRWLPR